MSIVEEWRNIENNHYSVSSFGRVRNDKTNKYISLCLGNNGYYRCHLWNNNKQKTFLIHRLVATAFIDNPENKPQVDHINNNKNDNRIENLRWVTDKENKKNQIRNKQNINEKYISQMGNVYRLRIKKQNIDKVFKTLVEAVEYRNNNLQK
jgi:hypothetical protein